MIHLEISYTLKDFIDLIYSEDSLTPIAPYKDGGLWGYIYDNYYNYLTNFMPLPRLEYWFNYYKAKESVTSYDDTSLYSLLDSLIELIRSDHEEDYVYFRNVRMPYPVENSSINAQLKDDFKNSVYNEFAQKLESSIDRFLPLFKLYEGKQIGDLIPKISSTSSNIVKFDDTPQTDIAGGYVDKYNTNVTKSESNTNVDTASLMTRLEEVRNYNASILNEWANFFNGMFAINIKGESEYEII